MAPRRAPDKVLNAVITFVKSIRCSPVVTDEKSKIKMLAAMTIRKYRNRVVNSGTLAGLARNRKAVTTELPAHKTPTSTIDKAPNTANPVFNTRFNET
jgi:hypothetical protein